MTRVEAEFDGKQVIFPSDFKLPAGQKVLVIFADADEDEMSEAEEREFWMRASEEAMLKHWNNPEDDVYNDL